MFLAIDIGNTNITFGVYQRDILLAHFAIRTNSHMTADELGILILNLFSHAKCATPPFKNSAISSVVPQVTAIVERAVKNYLGIDPLVLTIDMIKNFEVCCDNPQSLGMDRAVNIEAACAIYESPFIIVDLGTATTFCAVTKKPAFIGGAIFPGLSSLAETLSSKAAKLPYVEIQKPLKVIGTDTVTNIQSGLYYGYIGLIEGMIGRMKSEMNDDNVKVIASGGLAGLIANDCKAIDILNQSLTLEGIRIIGNY